MRIRIHTLRQHAPLWDWEAVRDGFGGVIYRGTRDGIVATLRAYAVLCGPSDDDFSTQWRVEETGELASMFLMRADAELRAADTPARKAGE